MWLVALLGAGFDNAWAQAQTTTKEEPKLGWANSTDLSLVVKGGNSEALTLGFNNKLKYAWKDARFESEVSGLRSDTSDDRFFLVDSGIEFPVGGAVDPAVARKPRRRWTPKTIWSGEAKKHYPGILLEHRDQLTATTMPAS